jgi:tetratricopeptide (TPR) repeat protein
MHAATTMPAGSDSAQSSVQPCAREAMRLAAARLDGAEIRAQPFELSEALADVARCYRALGIWSTAESSLEQALRWGRLAGSTDLIVDLLCELSESACGLAEQLDAKSSGKGRAARERARDHAFEASILAGRVADLHWEVQVLLRISDVLDRCGDRDDAMLLQTRALQLMSGSLCNSPADPCLMPSLGRLADS